MSHSQFQLLRAKRTPKRPYKALTGWSSHRSFPTPSGHQEPTQSSHRSFPSPSGHQDSQKPCHKTKAAMWDRAWWPTLARNCHDVSSCMHEDSVPLELDPFRWKGGSKPIYQPKFATGPVVRTVCPNPIDFATEPVVRTVCRILLMPQLLL